MKSKLQLTVVLLLAGYSTLFGQIQIHEKDYTLRYYPDQLTIQFLDSLAAQTVVLEDAVSSAPLSFERATNPFEINLTQLQPSQIFKIKYLDNQQQPQSSYIANSKSIACT